MNHFLHAMVLLANVSAHQQPLKVQFATEIRGRMVTMCLDGRKVEKGFAGKLGFRDQGHSWTSVCAAVRAPVGQGQIYNVKPLNTTFARRNIRFAGSIVADCFGSAVTDDQCAGLQLAVWEAIEDGGDQPNFRSGRFQAQSTPAVLGYAAQYYQSGSKPGHSLYLLPENSGQAQLTPTLVKGPAT